MASVGFLCPCSRLLRLLLRSGLRKLILCLLAVHLRLECKCVRNTLRLGYLQSWLGRNEVGFIILASILVLVGIADDVSALKVDVLETMRHVTLDLGLTSLVAGVRRLIGR